LYNVATTTSCNSFKNTIRVLTCRNSNYPNYKKCNYITVFNDIPTRDIRNFYDKSDVRYIDHTIDDADMDFSLP